MTATKKIATVGSVTPGGEFKIIEMEHSKVNRAIITFQGPPAKELKFHPGQRVHGLNVTQVKRMQRLAAETAPRGWVFSITDPRRDYSTEAHQPTRWRVEVISECVFYTRYAELEVDDTRVVLRFQCVNTQMAVSMHGCVIDVVQVIPGQLGTLERRFKQSVKEWMESPSKRAMALHFCRNVDTYALGDSLAQLQKARNHNAPWEA